MNHPEYVINLIEIYPDGTRRARVTHPDSGVAVWHGLGHIGEPLLSFLGQRCGSTEVPQRMPYQGIRIVTVPDHSMTLPEDPSTLAIVAVDNQGKRHPATFPDLKAVSATW